MEISAVSTRINTVTKYNPIRMNISLVSANYFKFPITYRRFGAISCKAAPGSDNLYRVLSLESEKASMEEIKKAYRSMALQYHPDLCPPTRKEEFTRMFVEVNKAYETLSDPILRRSYDHQLGLAEAAGRSRRSRVNEGVEIRWEEAIREAFWEAQLGELKRRSEYRMRQQGGGSWGGRMRSATRN